MNVVKAFCLAVSLILLAGRYDSPHSDGFAEYALQSCLTDCYATFRPDTKPTDYANCIGRCRRTYEKSRQRGSSEPRPW